MKIENRTELKEYRIECQKKQSADCRVLVCGKKQCAILYETWLFCHGKWSSYSNL